MEEHNYGSGIKSYSMSGDEALGFLDGLQGQMGARDLISFVYFLASTSLHPFHSVPCNLHSASKSDFFS